jgi:hypothetical protein
MCHKVKTYLGSIILIDRNTFHNYRDIVHIQMVFEV